MELAEVERPQLTEKEGKIWDLLAAEPRTVEDVAAETAMAVLDCAQLIQGLCVRGLLRRELSGAFSHT
jgi:hypothetical protein